MASPSAAKQACEGDFVDAGKKTGSIFHLDGSTILFLAVCVLTVLNLTVFTVKFVSVLQHGHIADTSGGEGLCIYNIWKIQNGYPLYETPDRPPYSLTLYNYGFYWTYSTLLSLFHCTGSDISVGAKLLTLLFGGLGAVGQFLLIRQLISGKISWLNSLTLVLLTFQVWFGTGATSWWVMSARPDVPSIALATWGLYFLVRACQHNRLSDAALASVAFFLAWTFKQSVVWILVGGVLFLLFARQWKQIAALVFPCGALMGLSLFLGGEVYRYNIIVAPSINPMSIVRAAGLFLENLLPNAFFWLFAVISGVMAFRRLRLKGNTAHQDKEMTESVFAPPFPTALLLVLFGVSFFMGMIGLSKLGSTRNHLFEAFIVVSSSSAALAVIGVQRCGTGRPLAITAAVLIIPMALFPAYQLVRPNHFGVQRLLTAERLAARESFGKYIKTLPAPVFIDEEVFAQPWFSTAGKYPAVVLDHVFYDAARAKGLLQGGGVGEWVREGHFRTLLIEETDELFPIARECGFQVSELPSGIVLEGKQLFVCRKAD